MKLLTVLKHKRSTPMGRRENSKLSCCDVPNNTTAHRSITHMNINHGLNYWIYF